MRVIEPWLVLAVLAVQPGCGDEVRGVVRGRVTFQGQPVTAGVVIFSNDATGVHMTADLDEGGAFQVVMARGRGLPVGTYRVSISPPLPDLPPVGPIAFPPGKFRDYPNIPARYRDPKTSGLTLEVRPEGVDFPIDMQP